MKISTKKITAVALAGMMSFGIASISLSSVSEASHRQKPQQTYADGTTNEYSHRMHEEETKHNMNVRAIRYQHNKNQIGDKEYDQQLTNEQKRHDREMNNIKTDYEIHNHHKSK
ncbi:MAG: hypothetical protein LKE51_01600 [Selenomonas sp.]|jgi:hypothetical protein|nr:hypothetical protein [Selenomonas sp.]